MKIKSLLLSTAAAAGLLVVGATAANADTVTVKAGDTVSAIAANYNTTISAIETANHLADVNFILVGQKLEVNGTTTQASSATTTATSQASSQSPASYAAASSATSQASSAAVSSQASSQVSSQATSQASSAAPTSQAAASTTNTAASAVTTTTTSDSDSAAKAWIANKESGGSYTATNGQYIGKYQLSSSYLNGDYSAANQERVANNYVASRYGSWAAAQAFWQANGWY